MESEADIPDPICPEIQVNEELTNKLLEITCNEVPQVDVGKIMEETKSTQIAKHIEVSEVNAVNKDSVGAVEGEFFLLSPSVAVGEPEKKTGENQLNAMEELSGSQDNKEKGGMITDKNIVTEAKTIQGGIIQTTDLAEGSSIDIGNLVEACNSEENMNSVLINKEASSEEDSRETTFEGEDEKSRADFNSVVTMTSPMTPHRDMVVKKVKEKTLPCDGAKDVSTLNETCPDSQKTEPAAESRKTALDKLGKSPASTLVEETGSGQVRLDTGEDLGEKAGMEFDQGGQEAVELSEKMKCSIESSSVKEVEETSFEKVHPGTLKETSETGLNDMIKDNQHEAHNQNQIKNIAGANSSLSTIARVDENTEPKADVSPKDPEEAMGENKDLSPTEALTMECKLETVVAVTCGDNIVAEEQEQTETTKYQEHQEQIFKQKTEPMIENLESPLDVVHKNIRTTSVEECPEVITNINEQRAAGCHEEILGDTNKDKTIITNDINNKEIPEDKNPVHLDEKNRRGVVIPKTKTSNLYVTCPPTEETVEVGDENHDEVSVSDSEEQAYEAFEVAKEKDVKETCEASKGSEILILEHTPTKGEVYNKKLEKCCAVNSEEELKDISAPENKKEEKEQKEKAADKVLQIATEIAGDNIEKCTFEENVPVINSAPSCIGEEANHDDQENESRPNSSEEATYESESADQSHISSNKIKNINDQIINNQEEKEFAIIIKDEDTGKQVLSEEKIIQGQSMASAGEELKAESSIDDAMMTKMPQREVIEVIQTVDGNANIGIQTKEEDGKATDSFESFAGEITKSEHSYEEEQQKEPDTMEIEQYEYVKTTTDKYELPILHGEKEIVEENLKEHKIDAMRTEEENQEVQNSNTECPEQILEATDSTEEREAKALEDEEEPNKHSNTQGTKGLSPEEIVAKDSNLDLIKNSSSMPETPDKETNEGILDVTVAAEEKSLHEADTEYTMQTERSYLTSEEKGLITTEMSENGSHDKDITADSLNFDDIKDVDILIARKDRTDEATGKTKPGGKSETHETFSEMEDQREITTSETSLDEIPQQNLEAPSMMSLQEQKFITAEVRETTTETSEKDKTLYSNTGIPLIAETTEENVTLSDNKSISPKNIRFTDIEEENPNNKDQDEDQELQKLSDKSSELNSERTMNEPVVKLSERVNTIETDNSNEIGKVETSRGEKLSDMELLKNKSEYEMAVYEHGSVVDTETEIVEQEDLAKEFGDSSNESPEIKKPPVHGDRSDDFETRSISSLIDKNVNAVSAEQDEKLRSAPESLAKDRSYKRSPEINQSNIGEDSYADENQNTDFTKQQISAEDNQGREKIMNKEMECSLETQKETNKIKDSSITEMEFKRHDASEVIKEQTTDDKTGTKELHMASAVHETVDKVGDLGLTPIQSFEATASNNNTEMIKSKAEEDFNQGLEASSVTNPSEELEKAIEKPTNVLTSVSEAVEEKITKKNMEDTENCDEKTDIAPTVVTSLGNVQLNDEPTEDFETSPDAKTSETTKRVDCIQENSEYDCRKLEETPSTVSQLPIHEYGNASSESIDVEQLETNDVEVEESKVSGAAPEYKDKSFKEIHEEDTSQTTGEVYINQIQKQITNVPEALTQPIHQDVEAATNDEFLASVVITEETSLTQFKLNNQPTKVLNIGSETKCPNRIAHANQQNSEVTSMELEETSRMMSHLPTKEPEKTEYRRMEAEKSEAINVDVEETKIPDAVSFKDQGNEEIQGTGKGTTVAKVYVEKIEKQIKGVSDALHEQIKQEVEGASSDTFAHGKSLQTEKSKQQLEDASPILPFDEKPGEITTITEKMEDGCTDKEDTVVDNLKLVDTSVMGSQLSITESESGNNPIVDNSGADSVTDEETKTLYTVSEPRGDSFEEIHKTRGSPTEELTEADEVEEIKEVTAKMNVPFYQAAEAVADCQAPDQPHPSGKLGEQLLVSSSSSFPNKPKCKSRTTIEKMEDEITMKADTEVDKTKLEEPTCVLLESPTTVPEDADNTSAIIDTPDANEVEAEEAKTSEATSESQVHVVEEIHSIEPDQEVGNTNTDKVEEEIKVVTETILEPNYQVVEAVFVEDIAHNQTLQILKKEQFCEKSSAFLKEQDNDTTTKVDTVKDETQMKRNGVDSAEKDATANPCLQDEGASELEVSNLDLTVQKNTQNRVPEKESKRLQEASTVKPQEYIREIYADLPREHEAPRKCEKAPIECSSQDAKDQGVIDPENSHEGLVKLPPYPTVKQLLPGEVGEKFLEASNLEFDKIGMVFQSASKFSSPELTYISQGIEIKKKHLKGTITEQRDGENHSKETTEADDAIKKDTSNEKAMSSDVILAKHEEDRPCDDNEETIKIGQLQITGLTVPQVTDATAGEATDEKVNENFNEVPIHAANSPTHESIGTCNGKKDITSSDTNYSPKPMDNEKLEHTSLEPACKGLILKNQEVLPAFSQEKAAEKGNKDTVDDKHYDFISDKQTMETVRVVEEVKCSHCEEEHKKNEEPAELQKVKNENKFDRANDHRAITEKGHKEGKHQKEKPYVLFHVEDPEVSNEKDIMDLAEAKGTSKDTQEQEKNSLPLSHEHIAIKADPSESTKNTNSTASEDVTLTQGSSTANTIQKAMVKDLKAGHVSGSGQKGIEYCEKKTMGEECQEAIENSILMDSTENSLSDMMQKSKKETLQMPDHGTGKRELTGDKEETQTQMAETAQAGEAKTDEENDEQEEIYEPKTEESDTYAPVIVETSRDSDVKTPHKKSHKILSGVGSRVKHSIAKVKKAIIGKSSHPKIQSSK